MGKISKLLHLKGLKRRYNLFLVNKRYCGAKDFEKKRKLLNAIGYEIGEGTKIVGPIECYGKLKIGENCWIGKNFKVNGNGAVEIKFADRVKAVSLLLECAGGGEDGMLKLMEALEE